MLRRDRQIFLFTAGMMFLLAGVLALYWQGQGAAWMLVFLIPVAFWPFGLKH